MNTLKRMNKLVMSNFDNLYKACKVTCKSWNTSAIPLNTLEVCINNAKIKVTAKELKDWAKQHNTVLDNIFLTCKEAAESMSMDQVALTFLKKCIYQF